ncbi:MAG TPA: Ig-like domain-containing protein, partial [Gemmatimonadales bacterium]|nr:Ig-like domain-containing protein [Gemmatimonadales bacterium]
MTRTARHRLVWLGLVCLLASCGGGGDGGGGTGPSDANTLERLTGDKQTGIAGQALPAPLVVRVHDKSGSAVSGVSVSFAVAAGGGSLSNSSATTDANGQASVTLTLGPAAGTNNNQVTASATGLTGSPVTFTASATAPSPVVVGAISPDTLTQGNQATITGSGFSATAVTNVVTIGGVAATVTSASATSLTITVPTICRATQPLPVVVTVSGSASPAVNAPVKPAAYLTVPLGKQVILHTASNLCVQLAPSSTAEQYLVGVQSVSDVPTSVTPITLTGDLAPGGAPSTMAAPIAPMTSSVPSGQGIEPERSPRARRLMAHRDAEAQFQASINRLYPSPAALRARRAPSTSFTAGFSIPSDAAVGDTVQMKFPDITSTDPCTMSIPVKAVVRAIGTHGIWLEDVANPAN